MANVNGYVINGINFEVERTWSYPYDPEYPKLENVLCVKLKSTCNRYTVTLSADEFSKLI